MIQSRIGQFDQAAETIGHDRTEDYGDPRKSFARIAKMWSAIADCEISPQQVAHMMIALKISRLQQQPDHLDSLIDIVGYARCAVLCGPTKVED
jgi:translation initiation factor 2 alpha subunit (eIF-2alpha)